jgi:hypothetical protein
MSISRRPCLEMVWAMSSSMLAKSRVSTGMAVAVPPASMISRATVEMVDAWEFGSGGKGCVLDASDVDFAATTTVEC